MATKKPKKGPDGLYPVKLKSRFPWRSFEYLPKHGEIRVDEETLDAMTAGGVIDHGDAA